MAKHRVLVTGACGYIAAQLLPAVRERYDLTLLDARPTDRQGKPVEGVQLADLRDPDRERYRQFFRSVDVVVHLAYLRPPEDVREAYPLERDNVDMAYNVLRTSHEEGVRRVVLASSNHAADYYESLIWTGRCDGIGPDAPRPLSDNWYGWSKEAYEHAGFVFASGSMGRRLEVVCLRIGAPREWPAHECTTLKKLHRYLGAYLSERDLQQLFVQSMEVPHIRDEHGVPFQVFYGISANSHAFWSIANARRILGYQPQDNSWLTFADKIHLLLEKWRDGGQPAPAIRE